MSFHRSLCIMAVLANSPTGASAGMIAKRAGGNKWSISKGQAERLLKNLVMDGYVMRERVAYRPGIDKVLYHMTEQALQAFSALTQDYIEMEKQLTFVKEGN